MCEVEEKLTAFEMWRWVAYFKMEAKAQKDAAAKAKAGK